MVLVFVPSGCFSDTFGPTCAEAISRVGLGLCYLMTLGLSKDIQCHVDNTFSKLGHHQIRHLATHKVGCQPADCIWSL